MRDGAPEPRTSVMIMVDASWEDQDGTVQRMRARMENKSAGGACIRLSQKLSVGTRVLIEGQWDRFSGEARYCRKDGREYLIGIQKDRTERPIGTRAKAKSGAENSGTLPDVEALMRRMKERERGTEGNAEQGAGATSVPKRRMSDWMEGLMPPEKEREVWSEEKRARVQAEQAQGLEGVAEKERQIPEAARSEEAGEERKHMRRKWFDVGHKDEDEGTNGNVGGKMEVSNRAAVVSAPMETREADEEGASAQLELLSMEDIYRMAGILAPRKGYSVNKIVEMLHSEHLRGSSKEIKRASVLMALDAAGVSVEEVLQDAKARHDAIDSYETEQRRQFEAQLARKAEENTQIQAELERVKARYTERLRRNLDGMAREKSTFGNWLTLKQQEAQSMEEAVELCLKPPAPEAPSHTIEDVSLAGARVKPV